VHCHDGAPLPEELHQRLLCDCERLALAEKQPAAPETAYYAQAANRRASVSISSHA
jgi:transposase